VCSSDLNLTNVIGTDPAPLMRDWATSAFADDVTGVVAPYTQPSWNWRSIFALAAGFPLTPHIMVNDVAIPVSITGGGVSYFRFTVPAGQQAFITVKGQGGATLPSTIQLTLLRNK
jgi:hypothetical protein